MQRFSPCGFDCHQCEAYIATQNIDMTVLRRHQSAYQKQMGKPITIDELLCDGCMANGRKIAFCDQCELRQCALDRGYTVCSQCPKFPCPKGSHIWTEGSVSRANLSALKDEFDSKSKG